MTEFKFFPEHDGSLPVATAVFQALGAASTCWESLANTGVFDSTRAKAIGDALVAVIPQVDTPNLGLATTAQLLDEIRARIEVDYFRGGGGLDYTSVGGRPRANAVLA